MKFEKINGSHLKFSLTYEDIASRGFHQEELWLNREKGEELVWTIIDEVDEIDNFNENEPIFIQVIVGEKGIDMIVSQDDTSNMIHHLIKSNLDNHSEELHEDRHHYINQFDKNKRTSYQATSHLEANLLVKFSTLDDLIDYTNYLNFPKLIMKDMLYQLDNDYYYYVNFDLHHLSPHLFNLFIAQASEFGHITQLELSVLKEYGTLILKSNVIQTLNKHFTNDRPEQN